MEFEAGINVINVYRLQYAGLVFYLKWNQVLVVRTAILQYIPGCRKWFSVHSDLTSPRMRLRARLRCVSAVTQFDNDVRGLLQPERNPACRRAEFVRKVQRLSLYGCQSLVGITAVSRLAFVKLHIRQFAVVSLRALCNLPILAVLQQILR